MSTMAKDIMVSPVISVSEAQSLQEVIELLAKHKFSGVPVVDEHGAVVGIISDTDIVRYSHKVSVIPFADLSGWISPYASISDLASLRKGIEMLAKTKVNQIMTKKVYTVREDTNTAEIAKMMSRRNINRLPVVDEEGRLQGIVTRADLVNNMAKV